LRAEQTVSEMVVEVLARQAEALSEETGRPFEEAFAEVLDTPAGRLLGELAEGPQRHERAALWQARLRAERQAKKPAALLSGEASTDDHRRPRGRGTEKRLLLVEDNEAFREAFAQMLELELAPDLAVAQAHSLAEAHAMLKEEYALDAALIDVGLPDGDGLDLVREIEEDGAGIESLPTLVITAKLERSVATRAMEAGARGVLSKVVSSRETAEAVRMLIGAGSPTR
jgi:CheY-like chemotaxis protein